MRSELESIVNTFVKFRAMTASNLAFHHIVLHAEKTFRGNTRNRRAHSGSPRIATFLGDAHRDSSRSFAYVEGARLEPGGEC